MNAHRPVLGFAMLLPVLMIGTTLLSATALASEDAFLLRSSVLHAERQAIAAGAARTCAASVVLRLAQGSATIAAEEEIRLPLVRCRIEKVELVGDRYLIFTSAQHGDATSTWLTEVYLDNETIDQVISREI